MSEYIRIERGNRYAAASTKRKHTELVAWQVKTQGKAKGKNDFTFIWHTSTKADPDNIAFAKKFVLDGLQLGGVIENDNQQHVGKLTDIIKKAKEDKVIVVIEPTEGTHGKPRPQAGKTDEPVAAESRKADGAKGERR